MGNSVGRRSSTATERTNMNRQTAMTTTIEKKKSDGSSFGKARGPRVIANYNRNDGSASDITRETTSYITRATNSGQTEPQPALHGRSDEASIKEKVLQKATRDVKILLQTNELAPDTAATTIKKFFEFAFKLNPDIDQALNAAVIFGCFYNADNYDDCDKILPMLENIKRTIVLAGREEVCRYLPLDTPKNIRKSFKAVKHVLSLGRVGFSKKNARIKEALIEAIKMPRGPIKDARVEATKVPDGPIKGSV